MRIFAFACGAGLLTLTAMNAQNTQSTQNNQEFNKFSFDFGAGFTRPVGNTGRFLNTGWNVHGGAGYNFSPRLGATLNLGADMMDTNGFTLTTVGAPDGNVRIFHATIDPIVHLTPASSRVDFYLSGGLFHRYQQFTAPTVVTTTGFIPFFGFYPGAAGANQILASYSVNKPGFDLGAGVEFGAIRHGKLFAEARYDHMFLNNGHTDFIPVTFGYRW